MTRAMIKSVVFNRLGAVIIRHLHSHCHSVLTVDLINLFSYSVTRFTVSDELSSRPYRLVAIVLGVVSAAFLFAVIGLSVRSEYIY